VQPGSLAIACVRMKNAGTEFRAFFVGYSIQDPIGEWHDAPSDSVSSVPARRLTPASFARSL
jgi:hypothetical protein